MTRAAVRGALTALLLLLTAGQTFAQQDRGRRLFRPEELGELEGPDRDAWQKPDLIMDALRVGEGSVVADVGAGGGWFTVRLARRVGPNGVVYAQDVQAEMLEAIGRRVQREGFRNVKPVRGEPDDPKLPSGALDAALIVDSYHEFQNPVALLSHLMPTDRLLGALLAYRAIYYLLPLCIASTAYFLTEVRVRQRRRRDAPGRR